MARYFLDTSALIKRYVHDEPGHAWISELCAAESGHTVLIAEVTLVEVVATFCRMARESPPRVTTEGRDSLITLFREHDMHQSYVVVTIQRAIIERAASLCLSHPLRAYDALQLACALEARDDAMQVDGTAPTFVCADTHLLAAARAEGLTIENPTTHA